MGATAEHDVEQLRARLNDYMAKHGLRSTEQRRLVTEQDVQDAVLDRGRA